MSVPSAQQISVWFHDVPHCCWSAIHSITTRASSNPENARSTAPASDWNCVLSRIGYTGAASPKRITLCMKEMKVKLSNLKAHVGMLSLIISLCTELLIRGGKPENNQWCLCIPSVILRSDIVATFPPVIVGQTCLKVRSQFRHLDMSGYEWACSHSRLCKIAE